MDRFTVEFYETADGKCPVEEFLDSISDNKLASKVVRDMKFLEINGHLVRPPQSKAVSDGLFELRTKQSTNIARVFYFFFIGRKIIMTNGFVKKTSKTPPGEKEKALKYMDDYLDRHKGGRYS